MAKKLQPVNYTSRDFETIRRDLETFAKRYYANTYKDFNEASFGSLMLDTVAYVGDILSFYLDYQTNESLLETAIEYNNVVNLARQSGYKLPTSPSSFGTLTFYVQIPAASTGTGPDYDYAPVLRMGSTFTSTGGGMYSLLQDVDFARTDNHITIGTVDSTTGSPLDYIVRAQGRAVSGRVGFREVSVGDFERFRKIDLNASQVAEVLSVVDTQGHTYVEVDHLSQNVIYKSVVNTDASTSGIVSSILKAVPVARRFVVEKLGQSAFLQFGYGSDSELLSDSIVDPTNLVLDMTGRDYITDLDFDPTKLISSDKFGIAPANTTLRISFRLNTVSDVNAAVNTIVQITRPILRFPSQGALSAARRANVVASLEVTNDESFVGDVALPSSTEIKQRALGYYAAQNRAVTVQDYEALCYGMPDKFGMVKRARIVRDFDEFRRNLNLYVISENNVGNLVTANSALKNNLRNWLLRYKMVNDTVDIMDAVIINFGINYVATVDANANRYDVLNRSTDALRRFLRTHQYDIGESILITDFYKVLQRVEGLVDVVSMEIVGKTGASYSDVSYDFVEKLAADGRRILPEDNTVFELKFPGTDIKGSMR